MMEQEFHSISRATPRSGKLPKNKSLQKLMMYAKPQGSSAKNPHSFELPRATKMVKEARNTLKQYDSIPSQTKEDRDRVRHLRSFRGKILDAEEALETEIAQAKEAAMKEVSEYELFGKSVMAYEEAQDELVDLKETGIRTYLELVAAEKVEDSKRLREYQLRKQMTDEHIEANFIWLSRYRELVKVVYSRPHDKWRIRLQQAIFAMEKFALTSKDEGGLGFPKTPELDHNTGSSIPGTDVPLFLRGYVRDINSYDEKEAVAQLQVLYEKLLDYEATLDSNFHQMRVSMNISKEHLDNMPMKKMNKIMNKNKSKDQRQFAHGGGEHNEKVDGELKRTTPAGLAHLLIDTKRKEAMEKLERAKEKLPPINEVAPEGEADMKYAVSRMMFEASQIPAMRGKEGTLSAAYHQILVYCAGYGNWRGALQVYAKLSERRIPATFPATYTTIMQAFKNAKPQPKSDLVIPLLLEAEACGFQLTREFYHSAMDVFRAAGHWRRAISIFNRMAASGINPTTMTYSLLEKSGASARNADPEEVYNALTFAGVPSYLSYTAATACALRRKPIDEGPTADWLGKAV